MEQKYVQPIRVTLMIIGIVIIFNNCNNKMEPQFKIFGDNKILAKMKINIEMIKDGNIVEMKSLLFYGNIYDINNKNVLRYHIYFSYNDSLIGNLEFDNFHGKIKGTPRNDIYIRQGDSLYVSYVGIAELEDKKQEKPLISRNVYFESQSHFKEETDLIKFTKLY
jgi:hypothetical protein